uniref:Enoyl-CoA hydratase/isomerase domain-containing protein n=1 Tax=Haptolina ericina TaxID=156174 RepID=A0A7S3EYC1_9EUKA|mmetsp:Transcript_303/g.681  ORF Transcript_303/g.681 Transcript_303/m.681 type:complete len:110 (+) Transcript_303:903-1232(+)
MRHLMAWASDARKKLAKGSPAALLIASEIAQMSLGDSPTARRSKALGIEFAANSALVGRGDFEEGVSCAVGTKRGERPRWEHANIAAAAADPKVCEILELVSNAEPLTL